MGEKKSNKKLVPYLNGAIGKGYNQLFFGKMQRADLPGVVQFLLDSTLTDRPQVDHALIDFAILAGNCQPLCPRRNGYLGTSAHRSAGKLVICTSHSIIQTYLLACVDQAQRTNIRSSHVGRVVVSTAAYDDG